MTEPDPPGLRLYRRLARLALPGPLFDEAEDHLLDVYRDARRAAGRHPFRVAALWLRLVADLLVTALTALRPPLPSMHDALTSLRTLLRRPAGALAQVPTLGVGVGAMLLVSVLVRDLLLAPLPFPEADRLVRLREVSENGRVWYPSWPNFDDWQRAGDDVLAGWGAVDPGRMQTILLGERGVRARVARHSEGFLPTVGVAPRPGRAPDRAAHRPGGPLEALVSESFWRGPMAAAPPGTATLVYGPDRYTVVGVLPDDFGFLGNGTDWARPEVWLPLESSGALGGRQSHGFHVVGRMRDGWDPGRTDEALDALAARVADAHGEPTHAREILTTDLVDDVLGSIRSPLLTLLAGALALLVVTFFNFATTLLARGLARQRELAVRAALGARRGRLVGLLLWEGAVVAVPSALLGWALARAGVAAVARYGVGSLPRADTLELGLGAAVGAVALALAVAVLASLLPAAAVSARGPAAQLRRAGARTTNDHARLWGGFIAAQVGLSLVVLVGAGLLLRSLVGIAGQELGYTAEGVLAVELSPPESRYGTEEARRAYYREVLDRLGEEAGGPGRVGISNRLPHETRVMISSTRRPEDPDTWIFAAVRAVNPAYFGVLGIPALAGDPALALRDGEVVVDQALVDGLWDGASPLGDGIGSEALPVGGVVGSVREWSVPPGRVGAVYARWDDRIGLLGTAYFFVPDPGDAGLARRVRTTLEALDPAVPVAVRPLADHLAAQTADRRLILLLGLGFGGVTLLLSAVGIHAMVSFATARRRRETGLRLALGAAPGSIRLRVLRYGLVPTALGAGLGLAAALPAVRLLEAQLEGVSTTDPWVLGGALATVLAAAALAAGWPAWRSGRVDPAAVLDAE